CVSLGIARAALDELTEIAQKKAPTLYTQVLADKAATQIDFARAEAALGGARAFLFEAVEEIWETLRAGKTPTMRQIATGRIAASHAADTAAQVARTASTLTGGSAIYTTSPMQRHARDAEGVLHHFTVAPHVWEEAGRVLLRREPTVPVF
ncbi:MAG: acyl-CoA dehydrogenase family protein, partial [Thermoanaerobaculia bacterium]